MLDVLLITIGSHGDVHPFVGIGRTLAARGHQVRIATNPHFAQMITRAGLTFVPMGDAETFDRWIADPLVWHPRHGGGRVLTGVAETLEQVYELTIANVTPQTLVVGSSLALGALVAAEKLGLRYATAHLAPICIRSHEVLPTLPGGINFTRMPRWFKRQFWAGADRFMIDPPILPALNALRTRVGLSPLAYGVLEWWNAPQLTLGLWPDWFGPRPPDAPPQLRLTGFPLYDEADHHVLDPELAAWLRAGDPPIAFTPGSAMRYGHRFFAAAAEACERLGRRGLLLTRHAEQIPATLPAGVRHFAYAPFSDLLPRCAAIVHHGGIGTTSQALRAGCPQLIMPMAHDQPDNAAHVKRLGVGDRIARELFWPRRVARKLRALIDDARVRARCNEVAGRFENSDPLGATAALIESLAGDPATATT